MTATPAGAIHDIGFRRYEGERLGRRWAFRSLLIDTVRGSFGLGRGGKAKALPIAIFVLLFFPVALYMVALFFAPDLFGEDLTTYSQYAVSTGFFITVFFATRAPIAVSRDLRSGVLPLYFSRPLARGDYVWARLCGLVIAGFIALAIPITVMEVSALLAKRPLWGELLDYGQGLATALTVAAVIGSITLLIAAVAPRRGWGVAIIVTIFIIANGVSEAVYYILDTDAAKAVRLIDPYDAVSTFAAGVLRADVGPNPIPTGLPGAALGTAVVAVLITVSVGLAHLRYRKLGEK